MREKKEKKDKKLNTKFGRKIGKKKTKTPDPTPMVDMNGDPNEEAPAKKLRTRKRVNREISIIAYTFVILFVGLIGYIAHFILVDSEDVINSSYNKRQALLEETVERGMILGSDGEVLAKTEYDSDGNMTRVYPYDNLFSHTVGRYLKTSTGLENSMTFTLLTSSINPIEKIYNDITGERSKGDNVVTTLDVDLQQVASDALGNYKGAVVVMEPSTGKVLAMVSKPDYDPNTVATNWESLIADDNDDSALMNRATQSTYPPGSIYKIVTALGYMRQFPDSYEDFLYDCDGAYEIGDDVIKCAGSTQHGEVTFETAFAKSCNGAYATMLSSMNLSEFAKTNKAMLFNTTFDFDFAVRTPSYTLTSDDSASLVARTAIGQGNTTTNPMHMAMIVSAIANGGTIMTPYMVDHIENYNGDVVDKNLPKQYAEVMTESEASVLSSMMELVVTNGTGSKLQNSNYTVAGKTGTAETSGADPYSWFVGFASSDQPDIVVSVCVEDAGSGSAYAVPIAKEIFAAYYK